MAHEVETMAYAGAAPWHIGETGDASKMLTEEERRDWHAVMVRAGLDWKVELVPVYVHEAQALSEGITSLTGLTASGFCPVPERFAVQRNTDKAVFEVVGPDQRLYQNETLFRWFAPFVESGQALFETAGSLRNGKRVWALVKLNRDPLEIVKGDEVNIYLLVAHAHDGSMRIKVILTPVRVVCANTLKAALDGSDTLAAVIHTESMMLQMEQIQHLVEVSDDKSRQTLEAYKFLASRQFLPGELGKYARLILDVDPAAEDKDISTRKRNQLETLVASVVSGPGTKIPGVAGTYWALYNGATDYLTHEHGSDGNEGGRVDSLWFGANAERARKALQIATQLCEARG